MSLVSTVRWAIVVGVQRHCTGRKGGVVNLYRKRAKRPQKKEKPVIGAITSDPTKTLWGLNGTPEAAGEKNGLLYRAKQA